jgi:hypothetical protein
MQFHRSLGRPELRPVEKTQAEINDCGVQTVERILEPEFMPGSQRQTFGQHPLKDFIKQLMGPMLIGIGQSRTPHRLDPKMIKRTALGGQSGFNAAQTVLASEPSG